MHPPFIFVKNKWINWRHGVDVSDDVSTTKAIRRVNDMLFKCFDTSFCGGTVDNLGGPG